MMEKDGFSVDNSYTVSKPIGNMSADSSSSPTSPLRLRLVRDREANASYAASQVTTKNDTGSSPAQPPSASLPEDKKLATPNNNISPTKSRPKTETKAKSKPRKSTAKSRTVELPACVGVITNREQLTRLPEKEEGTDLYVGDIIWAKVSGYPWWPCMVTLDPQKGKYSKTDDSGNHSYHVQYFGSKPLRSYTHTGFTMPFEGKDKYELEIERIKNIPGTPKTQRKSELNKLIVKPNYKKDWNLACSEAEEALKMSPEQRIKELTFDYVMVNQLSPQYVSVPKRKEDTLSNSKHKKQRKSSHQNPFNVFEFDEADDDLDGGINSSPSLIFRRNRTNRVGDFDVYCYRERSKAVKENSHLSEEEIDSMLKNKWELLPDDMKAQYAKNETGDTNHLETTKTPKTPKRSSVKNSTTPRAKKVKSEQSNLTQSSAKTNGQTISSNGLSNSKEDAEQSSDEESALVIAESEAPKKTRRKIKKEEESGHNDKDVTETDTESSKKTIKPKTPKTPKTPRVPKSKSTPHRDEMGGDTAESELSEISVKGKQPSTIKKSNENNTPGAAKAKPKKQPPLEPSQTPNSRQRNTIKQEVKNQNSAKKTKKTPKVTNSAKKSESKVDAKKRPLAAVPSILHIEYEETRTSEDASSQSEIDNGENKDTTEKVCEICSDLVDDAVSCSGTCLRIYHKKCLPEDFDKTSSQCKECTTGTHKCFVCNIHSDDVKKCSDTYCGKYYHVKCLQKNYPHRIIKDETSERFICPLHFCLACYVAHQDDEVLNYKKKRILKCLKCPIAYHYLDNCLAAGSVSASSSFVVCPEHYDTRSGRHVNVNWCFSCNTGGSLICCERCPAAFHSQCLEFPVPEGSFYCRDCQQRKQLHYHEIVWVKLGNYRWWPGRVCHPKYVPDNVMKLHHCLGEFPVYFFGSRDYYWTHRGRVFPFIEGDVAKLDTVSCKGKEKQYYNAIKEAIEAFDEWKTMLQNDPYKRKLKPPAYVSLRANKRVNGKVKPTESEGKHRCSCKPDSDKPCSDDTDCVNRLTMVECDTDCCDAGDKCQNRRFKNREYVKCAPFKTTDRGWGLKAQQDIKQGQFVIEYVGELIDEAECDERTKNMIEHNDTNFYFLVIDKDNIIDAGPKGNLARFMNHSCSPNCETQKWVVNGATRVGLFAKHDISAGTELTFNYNLHCRGDKQTKCECGAKNCSGFLDVRPKKPEASEEKNVKNHESGNK